MRRRHRGTPLPAPSPACGSRASRRSPPTDPFVDVPAKGFVQRGAARRRVAPWLAGRSPTSPLRIVGAHTDSPCLQGQATRRCRRLRVEAAAVEVYGGALLNSWLDRDLGVAGRHRTARRLARRCRSTKPIARVPQLAIHLDRDVNERGVILDKQTHLAPGLGCRRRRDWRVPRRGSAARPACPPPTSSAGICACSTSRRLPCSAPMATCSPSGRLDNQASCWAATAALCAAGDPGAATVGHCTVRPRGGRFGEHQRRRRPAAGARARTAGAGPRRRPRPVPCAARRRARASRPTTRTACTRTTPSATRPATARSSIRARPSSSTTTSATRPRRPARRCCSGCSRQLACRGRSSSAATTCRAARTIGPITATRLGIDTVDVGIPQLSMHSRTRVVRHAGPAVAGAGADDVLRRLSQTRRAWAASNRRCSSACRSVVS